MATLSSWLPDFVARHSASQVARRLALPEQGMLLYGTISHAAYLRADGTVWLAIVDSPEEPERWEAATGLHRIGALVLGTRRFPELLALLPERPAQAADCDRCGGTGELTVEPNGQVAPGVPGKPGQLQCPECGGLGWQPNEAA